ncbi:hypothetical protein FACS1894113_3710 [Alphaproteobacteria bacterium]|nr:hypothetical protein FACS1894113_3710 [Alphaproteobacteria bacterium]
MNILSKLTEKVTMLETNIVHNQTSFEKFNECFETRASVKAMQCSLDLGSTFELIILKPPTRFSQTNFSAIKWRNNIYEIKSQLKTIKNKFLKGTVRLC